MSLQPLVYRQLLQRVIVPYGWMAKILKISVFRLTLGNDLVSRVVIAVHNFFSRLCQDQNQSFRSFDPVIAQRSVDRFVALGAKTHFIVPRCGKGQIQMMTFKAQDLEQRIQTLGGSWERRNIQGREVFAIVSPKHEGTEWLDFKEKLIHFHWREEEGMIMTCDYADAIPLNAET